MNTYAAALSLHPVPVEAVGEVAGEILERLAGGLASASGEPGGNRLVRDDEVVSSGAVAVLLDDSVNVRTIVSQGCRPIGRPFTITKAERNIVNELAGQTAVARLQEIAAAL